MNKAKFISFIFVLMAAIFFIFPNTSFAKEKVYHIPVEKEIEKGLYVFLKRSFNEALENNASAIILEIHTPGGYVDVA